jgi:hypothetical protein
MPGFGEIEVLGAEEAHELTQQGRREIDRPSPDARSVLRLSEPWEFAMGAEVWGRVQLFNEGQDVTSEHPFLGDWLGVFKDHFLYPWDFQGRFVFLPVLGHDKGAALVLTTWPPAPSGVVSTMYGHSALSVLHPLTPRS